METNMLRRLVAEFLGTAGLLAAVVGSGIMAERLAAGNQAVALLANTVATGAALLALILAFAPVSGAHFNPAVTMAALINAEQRASRAALYVAAQIGGAVVGVGLANIMFDLPLFHASAKVRTGLTQWLGEAIAAFGLIGVIMACSRRYQSVAVVSISVAAYITAAYWFTSSTSFANPAVTIARSLSDTFAGIRPFDVPAFILAQLIGAAAATFVFGWLVPKEEI